MRKQITTILGFLLYLSFSAEIGALAIYQVELKSHLNQPLDARIPLLVAKEAELSSLNVNIKVVTDKTYKQRFVTLRYEIKEDEGGHYIKVMSREAIREPVLSFILELNWSEGRLIREYSLLIDPQ